MRSDLQHSCLNNFLKNLLHRRIKEISALWTDFVPGKHDLTNASQCNEILENSKKHRKFQCQSKK